MNFFSSITKKIKNAISVHERFEKVYIEKAEFIYIK